MNNLESNTSTFNKGLETLGFKGDSALFLVDFQQNLLEKEIIFHLHRADDFEATAVYLRKQLNGSFKPQVYIYDFTHKSFNENEEIELSEIQKKIWSSGEVPLVCVFYNTEIKILDCTKHLTKNFKPEYLIKQLKLTGEVHKVYNNQFAVKIKSGIFWEEEEFKKRFKFQNSSYDKLIENIRFVTTKLTQEYTNISIDLINKIIVQSILIKYLEERIDTAGNKLLSEKYFKKYDNANTFNDVLRKGKFVELLSDLNDSEKGFNGNIFKWNQLEQKTLNKLDLSLVADLLSTDKSSLNSKQLELGFPDWRYFEFKFIPVELISRLYEEFLGKEKKEKGLFYTPSHLAKLLVDESIPLKNYQKINVTDFKILDPACGSGIFLVVVFKRLVQIWRLQNDMKLPTLKILKNLLKNIYGVDKEEQAVRLASFSLSLALCNELNPIKIINELKFDDLREDNLIQSDFFECQEVKDKKFDLVIGNPPFVRGAISNYSNIWEFENQKVKIPQGQIALKFLSESIFNLKDDALVCLIIKSSGLLYNSTSTDYKKFLFSNFDVAQILDFTALARNKSLWDNGADVASAAIFLKNKKPNFNKNILHLTFRRTKATKERIVFEIDDYDLHFVNRKTAINNPFIWKNNLLGGGRIKNLLNKVKDTQTLKEFSTNNNCIIEEGFEIGSKGTHSPSYIYKIPFLPTSAISEEAINYNKLDFLDEDIKFSKIPKEEAFTAPNIIIWENIGKNKFPIFLNKKTFSFQRRLVSIKSKDNDINQLNCIYKSFRQFYTFYKFYFLATSSETLINRNNTFLLKDLKNLPFIKKSNNYFSDIDSKIIDDCIKYQVDFFIHGEKSKATKFIEYNEFEHTLLNYGNEFSRILNTIYGNENKKFRLSDVVELDSSLIATVFKFDSINQGTAFHKDLSKLNIEGLTNHYISSQLSVNRIIKLYPQKDTIVFVKPNQYRFWISLAAYRDADKCFSDLSKSIN